MSTDNVNGLNAARKAIAATAASVIKRDEELRLIRLGLQSEKDEEQLQTLILARALEEEANGKLNRIAKEAGQINYIRNGRQAATLPAPPEEEVEEVIAPTPAVDVEPEPTVPPAPPEEEVATVALPIEPAAPAAATTIINTNQVNNNGWHGFVAYAGSHRIGALVWWVAVVSLLVTFWIMHNTYPGFFPDKVGGLGLMVREFIAFLAIPLFFGFMGGLIGSLISWRREIVVRPVE